MSWFQISTEELKGFEGANLDAKSMILHATLDAASTLNLKTDTDWPIALIGFGSILASLVTIFFTYRAQKQQIETSSAGLKNQVRANAANLRNSWMEQLRLVSSEFLQSAALILSYAMNREAENSHQIIVSERARALLLQIRIKLYVGTSSALAKEIVSVSEDLLKALNEDEMDGEVISVDLYKLEELLVTQLEQAWEQAKADLGLAAIVHPAS